VFLLPKTERKLLLACFLVDHLPSEAYSYLVLSTLSYFVCLVREVWIEMVFYTTLHAYSLNSTPAQLHPFQSLGHHICIFISFFLGHHLLAKFGNCVRAELFTRARDGKAQSLPRSPWVVRVQGRSYRVRDYRG